jgi:hypothetical protein
MLARSALRFLFSMPETAPSMVLLAALPVMVLGLCGYAAGSWRDSDRCD